MTLESVLVTLIFAAVGFWIFVVVGIRTTLLASAAGRRRFGSTTAFDDDRNAADKVRERGVGAGDAKYGYGDQQTASARHFVGECRLVDAPTEQRRVSDAQSIHLAYLRLVLASVIAQRRVDRHAVVVQVVEDLPPAGRQLREELSVPVRPAVIVVVVVDRRWKAEPVQAVQRLASEREVGVCECF